MAKIFISYSSNSRDIVEELVQDLKDDDHEPWFDQRLTGGQKWWDSILSEIRQSDIFVAALTPDSLESQACQREMKYADGLQKPLLPVRLSDKVQPEALPPRLAELQWVDYCHRDKLAFKNLQRTIRGFPEARPLPDPLPEPPPVPTSYLSTLREQIETDSQLTPKDQSYLVFELKSHFLDGGSAEEIIDLLQRLKRRRELIRNVAREIDELLGDIDRAQRVSPSNNEREPLLASFVEAFPKPVMEGDQAREGRQPGAALREPIPQPAVPPSGLSTVRDQEDGEDPVPGLGREIKLDSAVAECRRLIERVLNKSEGWVFEIDPKNRFAVAFEASAATPYIVAAASLVDTINGTKATELKKLGWTVGSDRLKGTLKGAAVLYAYATYGLSLAPLLSRGVRNYLTGIEAQRSWVVTSQKEAVIDAATDLTLALRRVAPNAKTIIVRRYVAETQA